ncbi:MAG: protein-methionine-sulfoxide reductase heme-binding subunit MsrQ [Rhodoferax sp.]
MRAFFNAALSGRLAKPVWFGAALLPCCWLVFAAATDRLGANPAEALVRSTGDWTLRMLCVVLAITPLRVMAKMPAWARFRRMAGLFVYFYAVLHLLSYSGFDMGLDVADIGKDIAKRPFILVGFTAFVLLTPLALTSFNRAIRALGGRRWQLLHRLVYAVAVLAVLHFFWMRAGKHNFAEVAVYGSILASLLGWRLVRNFR